MNLERTEITEREVRGRWVLLTIKRGGMLRKYVWERCWSWLLSCGSGEELLESDGGGEYVV